MVRPYSSRKSPVAAADGGIMPTPERLLQGPVERPERPIADDAGRTARPYRAVDILATMERRGSITGAMRQAGEDFRARFATAQLDPLRALDYSRPRNGAAAHQQRRTGTGVAGRRRAADRVARNSGCRRPGLARRFLSVACRRLGAFAEGVGARAGLERTPGQPGDGLRHSDRRSRGARSRIASTAVRCEIRILMLTNPDRSGIRLSHWRNWQSRPAAAVDSNGCSASGISSHSPNDARTRQPYRASTPPTPGTRRRITPDSSDDCGAGGKTREQRQQARASIWHPASVVGRHRTRQRLAAGASLRLCRSSGMLPKACWTRSRSAQSGSG